MKKLTEEGETPDQIVPGTENPLAMPVVDRLALNKAMPRCRQGTARFLFCMMSRVMSMKKLLACCALALERQNRSCTSANEIEEFIKATKYGFAATKSES
jgi:hypothetical protein